MATCPVCGGDLPPRRGPRPRVYCSRACQGRAYRARQQQRDAHRLFPGDEERLLAEYRAVPSRQLADSLCLAAGRVAGALTAGRIADDHDLGVLARIPVVLAARAHRAAASADAPPVTEAAIAAPTVTVLDLNTRREGAAAADQPSRDGSPPAPPAAPAAARRQRIARSSRDDSAGAGHGIAPRPQKLPKKKAAAVIDAAELVRDPDHRDNHRWILRSGDTVLGSVEPSYGGASRSGRNGWISRMGGTPGPRCKSRDGAAVDLAARWLRVVTADPRRPLTGD
jgi:hypothetical protein